MRGYQHQQDEFISTFKLGSELVLVLIKFRSSTISEFDLVVGQDQN
jgi:hypothetical protein